MIFIRKFLFAKKITKTSSIVKNLNNINNYWLFNILCFFC